MTDLQGLDAGQDSSSLRPGSAGSNRFTFEKLFIVCNFGTDNGAESEFGTHKELIILNIFKYKINIALMSRDMSCDHFATILYN